jgi:hypothetical protein
MRTLARSGPALVLAIALAIGSAASARAGPEIFSIEPESGPAGTPIELKGKGLGTTVKVAFAIGRAVKIAQFKIVSDSALRVLAPECYRPGAAATIAVFTRHGAAVAMPATVQTVRSPVRGNDAAETGESFFHVLEGGILSNARGVAVIERGGVVVQSSDPPMQFVKSGGTLMEFHNSDGIVFYERAAKLGPGVVQRNRPAPITLVGLDEIKACPGVGPFRFQSPLLPIFDDVRAAPPSIRAFSPRAARPGEIVTVIGSGFARTTEVSFLGAARGLQVAGFRVVSDRELKVEVPEGETASAPQLLAIVTTEGLAVTVPRNQTIRPSAVARYRQNPALSRAALLWIGPHDVVSTAVSRTVFVSPGGLVTQAAASHMYFVQHDGKLGDAGQNPTAVFFEPGAIVPDRLKVAPVGQPVPVIVPSSVEDPFVIVIPRHVRG